MPLRIGAVAYTHYESDPRVRREAEAFAARGDDVTVWCLGSPGRPDQAVENGVNVVRLAIPRYRGGQAVAYAASYPRFMADVQARLARAHWTEKLDIVHVHTMPDFMVFAALIPRLAGAKVLLDMHDLMPELYALKFGLARDGLGVKALRATQTAATLFADAVLAVHQPQYELLLQQGVPARKLGIVMNAADPKLFPKRPKMPPIEPDQPIRVVYHGTILHRYGVDQAVQAFAKARQLEPRLHLQVLGGGDFAPQVMALAQSLGLQAPHFLMTGERLPLDTIAAEIRSAHLGLVPNRDDHEDSVLPTKFLEYLSVGVPAVVTQTRTVARFFDDRHAALVPVDDVEGMAKALVALARDPARQAAIIAAGHEWNATWGWETNQKLLFRTADTLAFEKVEAQRKAAQAAKEGVKTGTRVTPPKDGKTKAAPTAAEPG